MLAMVGSIRARIVAWCEVIMSTGLRSEVDIVIAVVCREVVDCFVGV